MVKLLFELLLFVDKPEKLHAKLFCKYTQSSN